ncbi:peptidoglycan DD-metalloendopeptidase family protein [Streptomyces spectabilis]|uniref:aggregation-promoting factor C-terminal-like domain-containing protein n=1 Tax=Streptomyces spectabilis TaxID=68270 RepID=UPI0033E304C1
MALDLDIVGGAAVDVVPIVPNFHRKLREAVLPAADRVGTEAGQRMGERMSQSLSASLAGDGDRIGTALGRAIAGAMGRQVAGALPDAIRDGGRRATTSATREGGQIGGALAQSIRRRLEVAFRSLPRADVRLGDTGFNADLDRLRARLQTLAGKTVGIDIDAGAALAEVAAIDVELQRLGAGHTDVNVRADVATARAALAEIQRQVNDVDRDDVRINVRANTVPATTALLQLGILLGGVAALPVFPVAAAGLGAIASMATVASAGVGSLALAGGLAVKRVASALQAKSAAEQESVRASDSGAAAHVRAAQRALQMASAQQSLAAAHRSTSRQIAQANRAVEDAQRALTETTRQATRQVADAERAVAEVASRAAEQRRQSARNVEQAERSLADTKRAARQAEDDLTQARANAAQQLRDLEDRLVGGKLSQRDATLRVQEAELELQRVQSQYDLGKATDLQLARARLAYDQAVQGAKDQGKSLKDLEKEAEKARKEGVSGNGDVKRAADALADAQRRVRDETRAVADAQREAARDQVEAAQRVADVQRGLVDAQRDAARSVADAQRRVRDAVQGAADAQVQAAEAIAAAERGVESARLSGIDTTGKAATKSDEYRKALAKLSPAQRDLFDSIAGPKGLTAAYKEWATSVEPDVLPIFTRAVNGAKKSLPGLTPLVRESARAVTDLQKSASRQWKKPFWQEFKQGIARSAYPAITGLGRAVGNVFTGVAGVIDAFLPHMDKISAKSDSITGRFAKWGMSLKGSPRFERFLDYADEMGGTLAETLGDVGHAIYELAHALSPLSGPVLKFIGTLASGLADFAENCPIAVQALWALIIANRAWNIALAATAFVMKQLPIFRVIILIGLLVAGLIYAYKKSETFRRIVDGAWAGIRKAAEVSWKSGLKPAFDGIVSGAKAAGRLATWLWREAIKPAFDGIAFAAKVLIAVIAVVLVAPLVIAFRTMAEIGGWLWREGLAPAFSGIGDAAGALWKYAIRPAVDAIIGAFRRTGRVGKALYEKTLAPAFRGIGRGAGFLYDNGIKPTASRIGDAFRMVGRVGKALYEKTLAPAFRGIGAAGRKLHEKAIKPAFSGIASAASVLWRKGLRPAFNLIKEGVRLVGEAFGAAKDAIGRAFGKIKSITKTPVNFVIKWVYTRGIKAVWDKVAKFVGLGKLPDAPKLLEVGGTVGSSWGVARPMKVNRPTAIVGEGNPRYPEYVIPTDPRYRARALSLHRAAGTQLLEDGGVLGRVSSGLTAPYDWTIDQAKRGAKRAISWAKVGSDLLASPGKIWTALTKPIASRIEQGLGGSPMGRVIAGIPTKMLTALKDKIVGAANSMFIDVGGGQWLKPVNVPYGTPFGKRGVMWSSGYHTGLDFPAPTGSFVKSVAMGRVVKAGGGGPYGNHVEVTHGGGLTSFYAHLSRILTSAGTSVMRGDTIGRVGSTGNTTGPHLHLEARKNGRPVDPMPYLRARGGFGAEAVGAAQRYAKSLLGKFGWGPSQFGPLKRLWEGESNWRWNADNPTSDAYGIPQALPGSRMSSEGADWRTNYKTQVRWGMKYIKWRPDYGTPAAAYEKWKARSPHWYDEGGYLPPGLSLVANGTGRPEPVFTGGQWADIRAARNAGPTEVHADVKVFVGSREITDIVRTEVSARESSTATAVTNGRWV